MSKPRILTGALTGGLMTAALIALLFLGDRAAGLPFVPFDVFDWMARRLPGGLVTFGIDMIINLLIALNLSVSQAAKTAEQVMAVGMLVMTGIGGGLALFAAARGLPRRASRVDTGLFAGLVLGLLVGVPGLLMSLNVNQTALTGPVVSSLWIAVAFLAWGALIGWSYDRLAAAPLEKPAAAPSAGAEPGRVAVEQLSRREFLIRVGVSTAAVTVVGAGLAAVLRRQEEEVAAAPEADPTSAEEALRLAYGSDSTLGAAALLRPPLNPDATLEPAPGTRPEYTPLEQHYRIDINARPPRVDGSTWRLSISGLVANPLELTLADLIARYEPVHRFVTLSCISNRIGGDLISTTLWTGARLRDVLADARPLSAANFVLMRSADGFHESLSLDLLERDDRIMLTYHWDGQPLLEEHGYPLRIYIPDRYGMKQPKWITSLELSANDRAGYWVERGWDEVARVNATAVIDTVAGEAAFEHGGQTYVPIGGIAYAGARGISKVEVQMDGGDWVEAELRGPLSDATWVIWRIDWPFEEGAHIFRVRCYEGDGTPQIARVADVRPSGATGYHEFMSRVDG